MKHIYIEVSEAEFTEAKTIGFFEVTDALRNQLKEMIRAQDNRSAYYDNNKKTQE